MGYTVNDDFKKWRVGQADSWFLLAIVKNNLLRSQYILRIQFGGDFGPISICRVTIIFNPRLIKPPNIGQNEADRDQKNKHDCFCPFFHETSPARGRMTVTTVPTDHSLSTRMVP